jgi:mono/diheme cytochrome c family protein
VLAVALSSLATAGVAAEEADGPERGGRLYAIHCASCHGADGHGDGPMREVLRPQPTDLTRLTERYRVWREEVRAVLTGAPGADRIGAHGPPQMPVWGLSLMDRSRVDAQADEVAAEIEALLAFLDTIQVSREKH